MKPREVKQGIYYVGAIDWDRRLFDELIPLPDGTSYNSYLIFGSEKTALIDTVDPTKQDLLISNLKEADVQKIDYIISHHAEQDHSGVIPEILNTYPESKVITNQKCKSMLMDLLLIPDDRFKTVEDGETLSLGNKTLKFIFTPWVHWPETLVTYLVEDRILFPCDFLGSHYATSKLFTDTDPNVYRASKRYYAEIMMPFRSNIKGNLEKIRELKIDIIAPSHGPIYKKPEFILDAYNDWVSDNVKNEVIIPYISMHGSTDRMVEYFIEGLIQRNIPTKPFNLTKTDIGELAIALVDTATIVIGTPTVHASPHPVVLYATALANALRPKVRFASIIGSYGWGGKTVEIITGMLPNLKIEILEPVIAKGFPKDDDFKALDRLADQILSKHKEHKLL
ncbi:MAG: FprA family A-type flavoprotein [bacterium]